MEKGAAGQRPPWVPWPNVTFTLATILNPQMYKRPSRESPEKEKRVMSVMLLKSLVQPNGSLRGPLREFLRL